MLKVFMARPVADAPQAVNNEYGDNKPIFARSLHWHIVQGKIDEDLESFLTADPKDRDGLWFRFTKPDGNPLLINGQHVAWIEEIDERNPSA